MYFVTTLSIYVGLVLIGASPQVLAQAKISSQTTFQSIELSNRADTAFAKLKHRHHADTGEVLPFIYSGGTSFEFETRNVIGIDIEALVGQELMPAANQKILTTNLFPRASIR